MVEAIEKLFGKSSKVLIEDGEFNDVKGEYHHYDYSQHITNTGCYNIIGNQIHNVSNISPQVTCMFLKVYSSDFSNWFIDYYAFLLDYVERGSRSMHHGGFATSQVTTVDANAISC